MPAQDVRKGVVSRLAITMWRSCLNGAVIAVTYALRACHGALLGESGRRRRCGSQGAAVGDCWLFRTLRGHLGGAPRPIDPQRPVDPGGYGLLAIADNGYGLLAIADKRRPDRRRSRPSRAGLARTGRPGPGGQPARSSARRSSALRVAQRIPALRLQLSPELLESVEQVTPTRLGRQAGLGRV